MTKNALLLAIGVLFINVLFCQSVEKVWFDKSDPVYGYYTISKPATGATLGVLFLLDGFGGNADQMYAETKIHNVAWANNLLVVGIPTGQRLYLDQFMLELMNRIIAETLKTYGLRKDQVAIGGMSSGGTIAVKYAERCHADPENFPALPMAVFDVDSPLDLVGLYHSSERELRKNNGGWWIGESDMIIQRLKKEIGDPAVSIDAYKMYSPFVRDAPDSANERSLMNTAVRTYHDVDIEWQLKNRGRSIYETNTPDGSEWISRLNRLGNDRAFFIQSPIHGRRSNGTFHPHSWNIVDETDLVQWIREALHFYPDHLAQPYVLPLPAGWGREVIMFPIDFAPEIAYKGFEELRFTPGWGDGKSEDRWGYTLLWWLDSAYNINAKTLKADLQLYFSGLTKGRTIADKQDISAWKAAAANVRQQEKATGDLQTYTAQVSIYDAQVTRRPATLSVKIHVKDCPGPGKVIMLIEVAGTEFDQPVWKKLDAINSGFSCRQP